MTLEQCRISAYTRLRSEYPDAEASWMVRMIFEKLMNYSQVDMAIKAKEPVSTFMAQKIRDVIVRVLNHEPIQYVFGEASFFGLTLKVAPGVLIPRPETEELVEMIVRDADQRADLRVLDICTGSGCIAIALARNLRFPIIDAIDISREALAIAADNVSSCRVKVTLHEADALRLQPQRAIYDIIVSNPPYIAESERATMDRNVTDHEPAIALFVPDNDPLRFYTAICRFASTALRAGGRIYFELNPMFADRLKSWMEAEGWQDISLHRDMQANIRFLSATRHQE